MEAFPHCTPSLAPFCLRQCSRTLLVKDKNAQNMTLIEKKQTKIKGGVFSDYYILLMIICKNYRIFALRK